ncbi:tyrosine-type recombinase/integrase (plasmid) [Ralstonia sp. R-29]|uniref:tyrosine-type recombinase/integrase n=1 Tax=Ralstonia sp. R-29 TaxID=3404059 RepID=UPI003CF543CC
MWNGQRKSSRCTWSRPIRTCSRSHHLHPHAYCHAFGTPSAEADVPVDVMQSYLGHASPATTALYNKAGTRRRQHEIAKLLAQ